MNSAGVVDAAAGDVIVATTVRADQFFAKDSLKTWDREKVAGGEGVLYGRFSFTRDDAKEDEAIKEIGWMTLRPGDSIGLHRHEANEDAYIIVAGEGTFTDSAGTESVVRAGDITIARKGEAHALKNTGTALLVFLDVIAQQ